MGTFSFRIEESHLPSIQEIRRFGGNFFGMRIFSCRSGMRSYSISNAGFSCWKKKGVEDHHHKNLTELSPDIALEDDFRTWDFGCEVFLGRVSNERPETRAPGCLGYAGDEILPSYMGNIISNL